MATYPIEIKYIHLLIWEETNVEVLVHPDIVDATTDSRNYDDFSLLTLKLFHWPHLQKSNNQAAEITYSEFREAI